MSNQHIYSSMAGDPEYQDLLEAFVKDLPVRAQKVHDLLTDGKLSEASDILHQLKGATGIYGFKSIYEAARQVEVVISKQEDNAVESAKELLAMCQRTTAEVEPK